MKLAVISHNTWIKRLHHNKKYQTSGRRKSVLSLYIFHDNDNWHKKESSIAPSKENLTKINTMRPLHRPKHRHHAQPYHSPSFLFDSPSPIYTHTLDQFIYTQKKKLWENLTFSLKIEILNFAQKIQQTTSNHNPTACCQSDLLHTLHQFVEYNAVAFMLCSLCLRC